MRWDFAGSNPVSAILEKASCKSMVFFYFKTATDGFPGLWVRPLPGADKGSSQRRRNRESADRLTGGRADDHVRKEISFPLEKTEKAVCTIPLVAQSARSEDGKHRRLFLMRWAFAGSNPCTPKKTGTPQAALPSKVLDPLRNSTKNTIHVRVWCFFVSVTFSILPFLLFPSHFFSLFPELSPPPSRLLFDTPL